MKVEVNLREKWSRVAYYFNANPQAFDLLLEQVKGGLYGFSFYEMTCAELCYLLDNRFPPEWEKKYKDITVKQYCELTNSIKDGINGFEAFLSKTEPPMTPEQRNSMVGLLDTTIEEMILLQLKDFFSLHSLEDAQKLTVSEFMIARKATYNQRRADYNAAMAMKLKAHA